MAPSFSRHTVVKCFSCFRNQYFALAEWLLHHTWLLAAWLAARCVAVCSVCTPTRTRAPVGLRTGNRRAVLLVSWSAPLVFMQNPVQARMSSCTAAGRGRKRRAAATDDALAEKVPPACRTRTPPSDEQPSNLATATATATTSEHAAGEIYTTPPPQNAPGMRRSLLFTCIPTTITHRLLRTQDLATRTAQNIWSQAVPLHRT